MPDEETPTEEIDETVEIGADDDATDSAWNALIDQLRERGPGHSRYVFEGELARGGMGVIHRVFDRDARRRLALKVMLGRGAAPASGDTPDVADASLGRFLEEAQVTSQLDHPGIVPVHEIGVDETDQVYFTMKLVRGEDLRSVFDRVTDPNDDEWTTTRALNVMLRVCEAMAYAHTKGVIHRDLKPGNVMVGKFGEAYVMDWGLAKVLGQEDAHDLRFKFDTTSIMKTDRRDAAADTPDTPLLTMDGDVVGTPAYMPPEQAEGRTELLGPPADVYAVGAMLYHLIAGHMPYVKPGAKVSARTILGLVLNGPPSPLAEKAKDVPPELLAIVEKAMAREIGDRYPDMTALARDLRAFLEQRVVSAYEAGAWAELKKWCWRNRALATTLAAALLAVVLLAGWALAERRAALHAKRAARDSEREMLTQKLKALEEADKAAAHAITAEMSLMSANAAHKEADKERDRVLRLSDNRRLDVLVADSDALWPAHPENVDGLKAWIERSETLLDMLPFHEATLAKLRARGTPQDDPRDEALAAMRSHGDAHAAGEEVEREEFDDDVALAEHVAELEATIAALAETLERERDHAFGADAGARWWHDAVRDLVVGLHALKADDVHSATEAGIGARLAWAETVEEKTTTGPEVAAKWAKAREAIKEHPRYGGLDVKSQIGLVPLGPDPESGLWEFWHMQSGARPERDDQGKLVLTEEMGIVLVLIPGGSFSMGAQSTDVDGPNYDPQADSDEAPVNYVTLDAFFLSKYEMTQGQWLRCTGKNPSTHGPHEYEANWNAAGRPADHLHPVEQVSWTDCDRELSRLALVLPTEAQWESACRAGTDTPWWTGSVLSDLDEAGNLFDQYAHDRAGGNPVWEKDLDDGNMVHAAVGEYRANAFGLHDTIGNLWEWCLDGIGSYEAEVRAGDGARALHDARSRVSRGGSFYDGARFARSAIRNRVSPEFHHFILGCRPARVLH